MPSRAFPSPAGRAAPLSVRAPRQLSSFAAFARGARRPERSCLCGPEKAARPRPGEPSHSLRRLSRIARASSEEMPGTCASSSRLAAWTPRTLPKRASSAFLFTGPTPAIESRRERSLPRSLRWYVIAKRCASSRMRSSRCRAGAVALEGERLGLGREEQALVAGGLRLPADDALARAFASAIDAHVPCARVLARGERARELRRRRRRSRRGPAARPRRRPRRRLRPTTSCMDCEVVLAARLRACGSAGSRRGPGVRRGSARGSRPRSRPGSSRRRSSRSRAGPRPPRSRDRARRGGRARPPPRRRASRAAPARASSSARSRAARSSMSRALAAARHDDLARRRSARAGASPSAGVERHDDLARALASLAGVERRSARRAGTPRRELRAQGVARGSRRASRAGCTGGARARARRARASASTSRSVPAAATDALALDRAAQRRQAVAPAPRARTPGPPRRAACASRGRARAPRCRRRGRATRASTLRGVLRLVDQPDARRRAQADLVLAGTAGCGASRTWSVQSRSGTTRCRSESVRRTRAPRRTGRRGASGPATCPPAGGARARTSGAGSARPDRRGIIRKDLSSLRRTLCGGWWRLDQRVLEQQRFLLGARHDRSRPRPRRVRGSAS